MGPPKAWSLPPSAAPGKGEGVQGGSPRGTGPSCQERAPREGRAVSRGRVMGVRARRGRHRAETEVGAAAGETHRQTGGRAPLAPSLLPEPGPHDRRTPLQPGCQAVPGPWGPSEPSRAWEGGTHGGGVGGGPESGPQCARPFWVPDSPLGGGQPVWGRASGLHVPVHLAARPARHTSFSCPRVPSVRVTAKLWGTTPRQMMSR